MLNCTAVCYAYRELDLVMLNALNFSGMIFTSIIAYFIFNEILDFWTAIGAIAIVFSSVYVAHKESKKTKEIQELSLKTEL